MDQTSFAAIESGCWIQFHHDRDISRFGKIRIDATNGLFSVGE
jgi:hypothetical protein